MYRSPNQQRTRTHSNSSSSIAESFSIKASTYVGLTKMAIFGKKKEKTAPGQEGSPVLDGATPQQQIPPPGSIRGLNSQSQLQQRQQPASLGHASKGSLSGLAGANSTIYASNNANANSAGPGGQQAVLRNNGAALNGSGIPPPGAAGGFKFGGAGRPDGSASGIPQPAGSQMNSSPPYNSTATMGPGTTIGSPNGISGLPTSSANGPPALQGGSGGAGDRSRNQQVVYPWSQRGLTMNAPRFLDEARQAAAVGAISPSPFPRYGHAANSAASATGEIYLFGGLVRESVKNDLYVVYVDKVVQPPSQPNAPAPSVLGGVNATLVQTTGEIPPPRVGHATVLVANVLILWGGDTKVRADDKQDEGLYLLNLSTREWTRVRPSSDGPNSGPVGRYGHTVSIVGSRFYVFGGQVDGTFMNDIWSFDLNSLKTTPTWELLQPRSGLPPKRTGHASVTVKDKVYIFGGTDGQYHYNDTWCYDVTTNEWSELSCIGYIPVPREGHAACLVDDVMYIFGGRGVDGKDLGDLASFRISNQRWYMFANMGPSPSGRSGHALTAYQNKVVVLGGESFTGAKPDDPSIIYVLDTGKIKYPPETASKGLTNSQVQQGAAGAGAVGAGAAGAAVANRKAGGPSSVDGGSRAMSPADRAISPTNRSAGANNVMAALPPTSPVSSQQHQTGTAAIPPTTVSDMQPGQQSISAIGGSQQGSTSVSPTQRGPASQAALANTLQSPIAPGNVSATSPPAQYRNAAGPAPTYNGPRSQRSLDNMRNGQTGGSMSPTQRNALSNGLPTERGATMSPGPQDGFHYGSMQNGAQANSRGVAPTSSVTSNGAAAASAEMEAMRKREAWMKAALAVAVKKGFIAPEELDTIDAGRDASGGQSPASDINISAIDTGAPGSEKERIVRALVSLKAQLAQAKANIAQQAQSEADRIGESDRARLAAISEAAFFRAKADALESGNTAEADRLQRGRNQDVERQLAESLRETSELERQLQRARDELKLEQQLRSSAEDRLSDSTKRAMAAEAAQLKVSDELATLQKKTYTHEASLRDHREQVSTLSALVSRHQADSNEARGQLDEYRTSADRHAVALRELSAGLAAATARASEHERLHMQHRDLVQQHEGSIARLKSELTAKSVEADGHASRASELESLVARHREEADTHRQAVTGGLAQVLAFHKQQSARSIDGSSVPAHVNDKIQALQDETTSLRQIHNDSKQAADQAHALLNQAREKNFTLEKQHSGLRTELSAMRSQLTIALQEVARLKDISGTRDIALRDQKRQTEAAQVRHALLRQFMSDRGLAVPADDELSSKGGLADKRTRELEADLQQQTRQLADTEARLRDASARVEELTRELDHNSAGNAEEAQRRATLAERQLEEAHTTYKERTAQLETDYQTAVQFVKGSEKMLRRMKDELTKYKTENGSLQNELMNARTGMYSPDNEAAKDIEALRTRVTELTRKHDDATSENRDLERRMAALIAEHKDFRDKNKDALDSSVNGSATQAAKIGELEKQLSALELNLTDVRRELQETLTLNTHLSSELKASSKSTNGAEDASIARDLRNAQSQNDHLRSERDALSQRLQETEDKLQLLLANDSEAGVDGGAIRDSHAFSITSELDKWERDRAGMPDSLPQPAAQQNV
jgi:hypothetical protein